ncbi:MAG: BNR repeat-containing protein [Marinilabiliales bacterium]|nr:BNR repeat-containing protein [Marinilabiliales bacterium]
MKLLILPFLLSMLLQGGTPKDSVNPKADGYKGIWFALGQPSEFGDKYSGGLGTYTANHIPIAIYAAEVEKTFFVYGGTTKGDQRHLLIMISYFDHNKQCVPKPVIVCDKEGVDDPHDNAALSIDNKGYIWVFVSGRNTSRPGQIFKSDKPWSIERFERVRVSEMTYPQPRFIDGKGFFFLFTKYTHGRELYWSTSPDGLNWVPEKKLAGMGGHYQTSNFCGNTVYTTFNYHPGGNVDKRTNIYLVKSEDLGKTWKTVDGRILETPLTDLHTPALVHDFEAEKKLAYINDLNFDAEGNPIILAVISNDFRPGPKGDPREWTLFHWKNGRWNEHKVCNSTHNYDMGSLYVQGKLWRIIGPTQPGPQHWGTGGEMALWESSDEGVTWKMVRQLTKESHFNHSYARRPLNPNDQFYAFWADGDADKLSESHLYFTDIHADSVCVLPYNMSHETAVPQRIK